MDFVVDHTMTRRQHESIWVIMDNITNSCNFIPLKSTYTAEDYSRLYIDEIVRWHRIPLSIISHRGAQFTSYFWRSFLKILGMQVNLELPFILRLIGMQRAPFRHWKIC